MPTNTVLTNRISELLERGTTAALITVVESNAAGAAVGAKMIVSAEVTTVGTFGSEAIDSYVVQEAVAFLEARETTKLLMASHASQISPLSDAKILFERIEAEPRLIIAGAGHVGASLARFAALAGFRVTLIDDRAEFLKRELFASPREQSIELVVADDWQRAVAEAVGNGRGVSVAIVTRGHKQDEECLRATLSSKPDYIGMIGSKRRTNIVLEKLREEGADENELKKVHAPIGLDIGAVSPEEVALAILAEIVGERRGGSGVSLSSWRRNWISEAD